MISCTEFIPLYSELFRFLHEKNGYEAVLAYWDFIASRGICNRENRNSLISFLERHRENPFEGAWRYWEMTTGEEACDLFRAYDPEGGYIYSHMRHCPSRGMLNELKHVEPYEHYCEHCRVIYTPALNAFGLDNRRDNSFTHRAECRSLIFVKGKDPGICLSEVKDEELRREGVRIMDLKREELKYLHRDFHFHTDLALRYLGEHFGEETVKSFLRDYTLRFYAPQIEEVKRGGLSALRRWIESIYRKEEALDRLTFREGAGTLSVQISSCPAVTYLRSVGTEVCEYFGESTKVLYRTVAEAVGLHLEINYEKRDGAASLHFSQERN